jgi:hypothetical protein
MKFERQTLAWYFRANALASIAAAPATIRLATLESID